MKQAEEKYTSYIGSEYNYMMGDEWKTNNNFTQTQEAIDKTDEEIVEEATLCDTVKINVAELAMKRVRESLEASTEFKEAKERTRQRVKREQIVEVPVQWLKGLAERAKEAATAQDRHNESTKELMPVHISMLIGYASLAKELIK